MNFQIDMMKKFELLDKNVDEMNSKMEEKIEKIEKSLKK